MKEDFSKIANAGEIKHVETVKGRGSRLYNQSSKQRTLYRDS